MSGKAGRLFTPSSPQTIPKKIINPHFIALQVSQSLLESFYQLKKQLRKESEMTSLERANTIKIGKVFYDDHCERDLIAPTIIHQTKTHYFIDGTDNEALRELLSDADHYKEHSWFDTNLFGLCRSAATTHAAIFKHLKSMGAEGLVNTPTLYVKKHPQRGY